MRHHVLLIGERVAPSLDESAIRALEHAGLSIQVCGEADAVLGQLADDGSPGSQPDVVVLGPTVPARLVVARRIRSTDPHVQIVFLATGHEATELRAEMRLAPLIGSQWSIARVDQGDVVEVIRKGAAATRQRRTLRTTLDRLHVTVASPVATDASGIRRLVISERRLAHILQHAQDAIITMDERGVIQTWNDGASRMFGLGEEAAIGQAVQEIAGGEWPEKTAAFVKRLPATDQPILEDVYCGSIRGAPSYVSLSLSGITDDAGRRIALCAIARDISHRMQLEQRFRATVESAPMAMVMSDGDGRIVLVNAETEVLFGYGRDDLFGQSVEVLVPERFRGGHPGRRREYRQQPSARRMGAGRELFGLRKDGTEFPVEIGLNPIETDEGLFVLSAIVDITERRQLEATQKRMNDELATLNAALTESNQDLQQFAHVASHDLQAPLRHISGFVEILERRYRGQLDEGADELIGRILGGVERMRTLISDLLDLSRADARTRPLGPVRLGEVLDDVHDLLASSIADAGGRVTWDEMPTVMADRSQLVQLLLNLVGNGIKYYGPEPPHVHVSAEDSEAGWVISVRDNGIGIARQHYQMIFEIFRRLHNRASYPGTGIGLAVCRRIVQGFGGRIWVESEEGSGSRFSFTVPGIPDDADEVPGRSRENRWVAAGSGAGRDPRADNGAQTPTGAKRRGGLAVAGQAAGSVSRDRSVAEDRG